MELGRWREWLVAQEVWRRAAVRRDDQSERLRYWSSADRELDFVVGAERFIEVKRGRTSTLDFGWFSRVFPRGDVLVVGRDSFRTERIRGLTLVELLLDEGW